MRRIIGYLCGADRLRGDSSVIGWTFEWMRRSLNYYLQSAENHT